MAYKNKDYYPTLRVGMYVTNTHDASGNPLIDLTAFDKELKRRFTDGYIVAYAWIIHNQDKVDAEAVEFRRKAREEMFVRKLYELRNEILQKEDLQNFVLSELQNMEQAAEAMTYVNARLPEYKLYSFKHIGCCMTHSLLCVDVRYAP